MMNLKEKQCAMQSRNASSLESGRRPTEKGSAFMDANQGKNPSIEKKL